MKKSHKKIKVVLIQDVPDLGLMGDMVEVALGYARNYLVPYNLALISDTPQAKSILKKAETEKQGREKEAEKAKEIAQKLVGLKIEIPIKSGVKGKVFGSVTADKISQEINKKTGLEIKKSMIGLGKPIKKLGEQTVAVKLTPSVSVEIFVKVFSKTTKK